MRKAVLTALALAGFLYAGELDDLMGGFEDESSIDLNKIDTAEQQESSWIASYGSIGFSTSYNYAHKAPGTGERDFRGFSRARTKAELTLDMKLAEKWRSKIEMKAFYDALYALKGHDEYTQDMLNTNESEAEFKEAYVQGSLNERLDLKVGRQTVVWGKSDNIRVTDVINPLDNREPGMVDIEDLRLPVVLTKLDYYLERWNLSAMVIHESRIQKEAAEGSDFLPTHIFPLPGGIFPKEVKPESNIDDTQFAVAANGRFSGWDLSVYAANVLDSRWHLEGDIATGLTREYDKIDMVGLAANVALGSWLLKAEAAGLSKLKYSYIDEEKSRSDMLVGAEYMGISDTTLSLEVVNRHILGYEEGMQNAPNFAYENERQIAARASYSFEHDKGQVTLLVSEFFSKNDNLGGFGRLWVDYDLIDALTVSAGLVDYNGGEKPVLDALKENDRVFADITYSF